MRQPGKHDIVEVGEKAIEWLRLLRSCVRDHCCDLAGLHVREHRELLDVFEVVRHPIDDRVAVPSEFIGRHVFWHAHMVAHIGRLGPQDGASGSTRHGLPGSD